jgi:hypothetical protein
MIFLRKFFVFLFISSFVFCIFSCKNNSITREKGWQFEAINHSDSTAIPHTAIVFFDENTNYTVDTFCGNFRSLPRYLLREDLPDSAIAVCKGEWLGAPKWVCAVAQNGGVVFMEADEDNAYYNDDDNELPLNFRLLR